MTERISINRNETEQLGDGTYIGEIFQVLWRRKWLVMIVMFLDILLGVAYIYQLVPRYTATTTLVIEDKQSKIGNIESLLANRYPGDRITGILETLKSRELAGSVVESLALDSIPEFNSALIKAKPSFFYNPFNELIPLIKIRLGVQPIQIIPRTAEQLALDQKSEAIGNFLGKLNVTQLKKSNVIYISFESEDPDLAAKIANQVAKQFSIGQLEAKFQETKIASDWLYDKLASLKNNIDISERAVENYRHQKGLALDKNNVGLIDHQLSDLNSQLIAARAEASTAQVKYNQYKQALLGPEGTSEVSDVLKSPIILNLKQEEAKLQGKFSDLSSQLTMSHPQVIKAQAELTNMSQRIKIEIEKFVSASRNELELANTRVEALTKSLEEYKSKTSQSHQEEIALRALQREAQANKVLYETFLTRFKETIFTQGSEDSSSRVITKAEAPKLPSYPKKRTLLMVVLIAGLSLAAGLVYLLESLSPGIRTPEQVEEYLRLHTLGIVPAYEGKVSPYDYILNKPHSFDGEAINSIRVSLAILNPDKQVKSVLVTSALGGEGKSTLATMLARMAAQAGQKVLLMDVDLRKPSIEKMLRLPSKQLGLTDILVRPELSIQHMLLKDEDSDLKIMPIGLAGFVNSADLFASQRMKTILNELEQAFDLIILDSPPVMAVTDTKILAGLVDKTIFVLKWDSTPKNVARAALNQLSRSHVNNLAGVVLQQVDMKQFSNDSAYGYSYSYAKHRKYYMS